VLETGRRPVIFLAFANAPDRYLPQLHTELSRVRDELEKGETRSVCEVVVRPNASIDEILGVFRDSRYRDRVAVLHFGGHAGGYELLMASAEGRPELAHAKGLADFLGQQNALQLVFLNGCSTAPQVERLHSHVPAVIATSESIKDTVAMMLSVHFYASLASGATVERAYDEAVAAVKTVNGDRTRDVYRVEDAASDHWPWDLHVREGAEIVREWSLPKAAGDPLFGLPPLPEQDLPATPYRHLQWFREEDAELFFGRGRETRALYELVTSPSSAPIVLFYGQSGVGKSSMLAAGLLPRQAASHGVRYTRRQRDLGLVGTMAAALGAEGPDVSVAAAWHAVESAAGRPLVIILDQVEEVYTRPRTDDPDELERFLRVLSEIFAERPRRPRGKLVLAFRKEWLADLEARLREKKLALSKSYLERLDRDGIIEIVKGPERSERLRRHYRLAIDSGLAEVIADDLLADSGAPIAPVLEILLTKMWAQATALNPEAPKFTNDLYQELHSKGLLLDDFVEEQMNALREWNPKVVDSGLAEDVLAFHTTSLGTAESRRLGELDAAYAHQKEVLPALLQRSKDLYLLVDYVRQGEEGGTRVHGTRLAHDTLAPLIRRRFEESDLPGQRARRILENRIRAWRGGKTGTTLDVADLATVEQGKAGMPAWSSAELRLIEASRASERQVVSRALASRAKSEPELDLALLLSVEAVRAQPTFEARDALLGTLLRPTPRLVRRLAGHSESVMSVVFSPDGTTLASGSRDDTVRLWDVKTRRPIGEPLAGHGGSVASVAFSPDGTTLASGSSDHTVRLWDVHTRRPTGERLAGHTGNVESVAFSPDGTTLASAGLDKTIRLWDVKTGQPIGEPLGGHTDYVESVAFSPDGTLASGSIDETIRLWDVQTRRQLGEPLTGHTKGVLSVAFSPDGTTVASGSADDTVRLWDVQTLRPIGDPLAGHTGGVWSVVFSPDGTTLASGGRDQRVRLWDVKTRRPIGEPLAGHPGVVLSVAFSPDGTTLASSSGGADDTVRLWDVKTRRPIGEPLAGHPGVVPSVAFSPDGTTVASGSVDDTVRLWDVQTRRQLGEPLTGHTKGVSSVGFSPDGTILASGGGIGDDTVRLWDVQTRRQLGEPLTGHTNGVSSVGFSPDGTILASGGGIGDNTVRLWDVQTLRPIGDPLAGHTGGVWSVAFSPDGTTLASGGGIGDHTVRLWDVQTLRPIGDPLAGHTGGICSVAFSPDGTTLASGNGGHTVQLWDVRTRRPIGELLTAHTSVVESVAFSPVSTILASGSWDATVRLWDVETRRPIGEPLAHPGAVYSVAFSPDGTTLASGSEDGTIRLWDVETRRPIGEPLPGHTEGVQSVAFSPDGTTLASGSQDGTIRLWAVSTAAWIGLACELPCSNLPFELWARVFPEREYECTCPALPPGEGVKECPGQSHSLVDSGGK